jgi:hypothetical protein
MEFRLPARGEGSDPSQWPLRTPVREFPAWWPYGYTSGLLFWRASSGRPPRCYYDTAPPLTMQIIAEDGETLTLPLPAASLRRVREARSRQRSVHRLRRR